MRMLRGKVGSGSCLPQVLNSQSLSSHEEAPGLAFSRAQQKQAGGRRWTPNAEYCPAGFVSVFSFSPSHLGLSKQLGVWCAEVPPEDHGRMLQVSFQLCVLAFEHSGNVLASSHLDFINCSSLESVF